MYEHLKHQVDTIIAKQKNCCSIGCSHCCYQTIELLDIEFASIENAINNLDEDIKNIIFQSLEEYWTFFDEYTPNDRKLNKVDVFTNFRKLPKSEKTKCPLLIENKCSIYKDRPLTCRIHIVETAPELCKAYLYRDSTDIAMSLRDDVVHYLRKHKEIELKPLAYLVSEIIDPKRKLKPLAKMKI